MLPRRRKVIGDDFDHFRVHHRMLAVENAHLDEAHPVRLLQQRSSRARMREEARLVDFGYARLENCGYLKAALLIDRSRNQRIADRYIEPISHLSSENNPHRGLPKGRNRTELNLIFQS